MKRIARILSLAPALLLAACTTLSGPHEVDVPLTRIQDAVAQRFPFNNRYLKLLDIRVANPHVALQPESNRILTTMDTSIAPPFLKQTWSGNLALSGQLRIDPARNALVLAEPRVERFNLSGFDPLYANQTLKIGHLLAEQLLTDLPLYTFRPEDLRYAGASFRPTKITARADRVVVSFEPAP
jgi:hypothetical protein